MHIWKKKTQNEIKQRVFGALNQNVDYNEQLVIGIPASNLDAKVFNQDVSFLQDAPFMSALVANPNHIGCHTLGKSESFFKGTQEIERELIEICAVDIFKAKPNQIDGYVASGGTEANIQAMWMYRNYFRSELKAKNSEIAIICSADAHYSMDKGANLLDISIYKVPVDFNSRSISQDGVEETINAAKSGGIKHFIVVCNMMTTMFGSVDDPSIYTSILEGESFKMHVDAAYGGFYYPFVNEENNLNFSNPAIDSVTLDAHKMAQAPYGTGIFLSRKGLIQYANTQSASYVEGEDFTLIGSRSGANAIAAWMILSKHGPYEWSEKIYILQKRTAWMCQQLDDLNIDYFRDPAANIITIHAKFIKKNVAQKFGLVPDSHDNPKWYKIVVMEHVTIEKLQQLIEAVRLNKFNAVVV